MLDKIKGYFKRLSAFGKGLWIYGTVLTVLAVAVFTVLWTFLASYQSSLPRYFAENYVKTLNGDDIVELYKEALADSCEYETPEEAARALAAMLTSDGSIRARKDSVNGTDDAPVFKLLCGKNNIGKLYLVKGKSGSYGFSRWRVEKLIANSETVELLARQRTYTVPAEAVLFINGKQVDIAKAITADDPFMSPLEKQSALKFVSYEVLMPFSSDEVSVKYNGGELEAKGYCYDYPGEARKEYSLTVPSTAAVYINNLMLPESFITEKGVFYPNFSALEEKLDAAPRLNTYKVTSLTAVPEIKVIYNGHELKGDGSGVYLADDVTPTDYTLYVPNGAAVTVNGIAVDASYEVSQGSAFHEIKKYTELLVNPILNTEYSFKGLLVKPTVVVTHNGKTLELTDNGDGVLQCKAAPDSASEQTYETLALDFTAAMMSYMYGGREVITETFNAALALTKHDSDAYRKIKDTYSGMYYRVQMDVTYHELYVDSFAVYADNAFYCEVHYDLSAYSTQYNKSDKAAGVYKLVFIKQNGVWLVYDVVLH